MKYSPTMRYFIQPMVCLSTMLTSTTMAMMSPQLGHFNKSILATSNGWDIKKAFMAYATANQLYWTSRSNFQSGLRSL
ncbi:hypothetical protein OK016_22305 [Vibrio chagasii]|nr:hypothetical protein [Vibrio chagasii]